MADLIEEEFKSFLKPEEVGLVLTTNWFDITILMCLETFCPGQMMNSTIAGTVTYCFVVF